MTQQPFEVGLVMAGAISAGAYTAGALDFLIEALDQWEDAKASGQDVPPHDVQLKVMAGASAGSMCAAIAGTALAYRHTPVHAGNYTTATNPFFQSWVKDIDISYLLDTADIDKGQALHSFLNSDRLLAIVTGVLNMSGEAKTRRYVANPLAIRLSVGNLKGIPYRIGMTGRAGAGHAMALHGDNASFIVSADSQFPVSPPDWTPLARPNSAATDTWAKFGTAALASGAFPLFLRPRVLSRPTHAGLAARSFVLPGDGTDHPVHGASQLLAVPPAWPDPMPPDPYDYLSVDGGIIDNEPLEMARETLAGKLGRNPRDGKEAKRALLMIDPFVDDVSPGPAADLAPLKVIGPLTGAWKNQCRFKPADLALAHMENVYSRFLIAPSRDGNAPGQHPCASGGLGGFLGFFHQEFRVHDYLLGRRNCQHFLRQHFSLPEANPLFSGWSAAQRQNWGVGDSLHLPIVPLVGSARETQQPPAWPAGRLDAEALRAPIDRRAHAVFNAMVADLKWLPRQYVRLGWTLGGRGAVVDTAIKAVKDALTAQKL